MVDAGGPVRHRAGLELDLAVARVVAEGERARHQRYHDVGERVDVASDGGAGVSVQRTVRVCSLSTRAWARPSGVSWGLLVRVWRHSLSP